MDSPDVFAARSFLDSALLAKPDGPTLPKTASAAEAARAAQEFEAFFLAQVVDTMSAGVEVSEPFGGGPGEQAWRSQLAQAFADAMAAAGGVGLADRLKAEIIALQAQETN